MLFLFANFAYKSWPHTAFLIIATLLCKITQPHDEFVLEIFRHDINVSFVPDSELSEGNPLEVLLQVANLLEEPMETKMLPDLSPQTEAKPEPTKVNNAAQSDSKLCFDDFQFQPTT